ncbi:RNA-binding protein [Candidatus Roizmanbacteria bacterium]|nr:RNA-binding protein [Candidatus Roizmanbacteria bacterium]
MDKKKLFVGSLPWSLSSHSLRELFTQYGEIVDAIIISDSATGRSKGFGFVTFANEADAAKAQAEMNGKDVEGRNIVVNFAKPREDRGGFRGNRDFRRGRR